VSQEFEAGDGIPAAPTGGKYTPDDWQQNDFPKRFGFGFLMISSKLRFTKQGAIS